jgi:hypothetical protein
MVSTMTEVKQEKHEKQEKSKAEVRREFDEIVNMGPNEIESWLSTDASRSVESRHDGEQEYQTGRRIAERRRKQVDELDQRDYAHMRKVIGHVRRHLVQRPAGNARHMRWRWALMNWGHDPLKTDSLKSRAGRLAH